MCSVREQNLTIIQTYANVLRLCLLVAVTYSGMSHVRTLHKVLLVLSAGWIAVFKDDVLQLWPGFATHWSTLPKVGSAKCHYSGPREPPFFYTTISISIQSREGEAVVVNAKVGCHSVSLWITELNLCGTELSNKPRSNEFLCAVLQVSIPLSPDATIDEKYVSHRIYSQGCANCQDETQPHTTVASAEAAERIEILSPSKHCSSRRTIYQ